MGEAPAAIDEILPPQSASDGAEEEVTAEPDVDSGATDTMQEEVEDGTAASPDAGTAHDAIEKETDDAADADVPQVEPEKKD